MRIWPFLLNTFCFVYQVSSQNNSSCTPCETISSLLVKCNLPALSTDYRNFNETHVRNITHAPDFFNFHPENPSTKILSDYDAVSCFCASAIHVLRPCADCTTIDDEVGTADDNRWGMAWTYLQDCRSFGYFVNSTQAYPSTTRTSLPRATASPPQKDPDCPVCDPIASQLTECNATSISGATYMPLIAPWIKSFTSVGTHDDGLLFRWILMNRTMGECICTLPVLRRLDACWDCSRNFSSMVYAYRWDCTDLGYFTDEQTFLPPGVDSGGNAISTSSAVSTPTETQKISTTNSASTAIAPASGKNAASKRLPGAEDLILSAFGGLIVLMIT